MIVHPGLTFDPIRNATLRITEVATILSQKYERLVKQVAIDGALLTVRAVVWKRPRGPFILRNRSSEVVEKVDNLA